MGSPSLTGVPAPKKQNASTTGYTVKALGRSNFKNGARLGETLRSECDTHGT